MLKYYISNSKSLQNSLVVIASVVDVVGGSGEKVGNGSVVDVDVVGAKVPPGNVM